MAFSSFVLHPRVTLSTIVFSDEQSGALSLVSLMLRTRAGSSARLAPANSARAMPTLMATVEGERVIGKTPCWLFEFDIEVVHPALHRRGQAGGVDVAELRRDGEPPLDVV